MGQNAKNYAIKYFDKNYLAKKMINNIEKIFNQLMNFKKFYKKIGLEKDILKNKDLLNHSICKKHILVIGGAGTIGSNYIKQILRFKPSLIVVVDIDENGLTEITRDHEVRIS